MQIPIGFRFSPTDEDLVNYYLKNKVTGQLPPWFNMIVERDIYGDESPWNIFNDNDPWVRKPGEKTKSLYCFTSLEFKGKKKNKTDLIRFARQAGNGTWRGVTGSKDVFDRVSGGVVGKTEMLAYVSNDHSLRGSRGHWYMHEYALTDPSSNTVEGNCVLCKITRDDSKLLMIKKPPPSESKKRKSTHASDQEEVTDDEANTGMTINPKFLGEGCSTVPQPDQDNVSDNFFDGFTKEVEQMLMDGDTDTDFGEANTGMMMNPKFLGEGCSTVPDQPDQDNVSDDFFDGFTKEVEQMLMDGDTDTDFGEANMGMMMNPKFLGEGCSTVPDQPDQDNVSDGFFDGFMEEIEQMLMDEDTDADFDEELQALLMSDDGQEYQGSLERLARNDHDLERASKRMRSESLRI